MRPTSCISSKWPKNSMQFTLGMPFLAVLGKFYRNRKGFNYCLNSAWHGGDQFVALLRGGMKAQVSLTVVFSSSCIFCLLFLIFLLTIPHRFSVGFRSGEFVW